MSTSEVSSSWHGWPTLEVVQSDRREVVVLREGLDIALRYFNDSDGEDIRKLTSKARSWADRYYKKYNYAAKRPTGLLKTYPNLFNLKVQSHQRLAPAAEMAPSSSPVPQQTSPPVTSSEAFPEFTEPILASSAQLDEIVNLRPRHPVHRDGAKPVMRVDASMLRSSGLLGTLPDFLGQLARANLETETLLASNPEAVSFELDEEAAVDQPHIEMNLYSGLIESQARRNARRIILPGGRPFKIEKEIMDHVSAGADEADNEADGDSLSSGDESDVSTSTTASLRANRKRKAEALLDADDSTEPPLKFRTRPQHQSYDMRQRRMVIRQNPAAGPDSEPAAPASPALSTSSTGSTGSSVGPTRIIKIKVPASSSSSNSSSSSDSEKRRPSTPDFPEKRQQPTSTSPRIIIKLKDPRSSPSSASSSAQSSPQSRPIKKLKLKLKDTSSTSIPPLELGPSGSTSSGTTAQTNDTILSRPPSSGSDSSVGSSGSKIKRIRVIRR
ncbi:hypothetical protein B0T22DRAFT_239465 [Podospora appendiculata]|uniref:Uncharacterized protein n=1 Tax=Podospora appendiculata TaxID=314037 RepID=A0AAE1CAW8_9PEZI|nr:hypothetical protein B0T22DRAFT_239465 [Podospora appendiculata]